MALSSLTSSSVPSSPLSEKSASSQNTSAPLLNRRLTQTNSAGHHEDVEPAMSSGGPTDDGSVPHGWPKLAKVMTERPTLQSFPRFHEANIKNLLYYQVQIDKLQEDLKEQEREDYNKTARMDPLDQRACFADIMVQDPSSPQWRIVLELHRALIELSQVSALPEPSTVNVQTLFQWLTDASRGGGNSKVNGSGSKAWGNQGHVPPPPGLPERTRALIRSVFLFWKDQSARTNCKLVVPCKAEDRDGFTGWVADYWTPFWVAYTKHRRGEDGSNRVSTGGPAEDTFETYPEKNMQRFTSAVATVVACLLPTLAISVLTTARGMTETLLYIGGFTVMFAIGLMILAKDTSTVQTFTATAAFSAVLVVFVQNQQA
ncbi:hypothetical protein B0T18DRAFT_57313 [Schizothecium vesticola]|uniref:DUF6594 domain-containing protein n=1 Tax=Schizothecium vesticola TaxID=314040 RepID=A0AA40F4M8_9PEZI|nr:hypothetical protein B0T18DRAFT_57313 [Schizothecium vesticola]